MPPWRWRSRASGPSDLSAPLPTALGEAALEIGPYPVDGDGEHALPLREEVDDRLGRLHRVDPRPVGHEGGSGCRLPELAERADRPADLLKAHPGVQQLLDHLELCQILKRVQPLRARALRVLHGRAHEPGPGPVVELPVADADDPADLGNAVPLLDHHSSVITRASVRYCWRRGVSITAGGRRDQVAGAIRHSPE